MLMNPRGRGIDGSDVAYVDGRRSPHGDVEHGQPLGVGKERSPVFERVAAATA